MAVQPVELTLDEEGRLLIDWSDESRRRYAPQELRDGCPCATCREKRNAPAPSSTELPVLSMAETQPIAIQGMEPVGHYAYSIHFSDGHDTGIYTFELLLEQGKSVAKD